MRMNARAPSIAIALPHNFGWEITIINMLVTIAGIAHAGFQSISRATAAATNRLLVEPLSMIAEGLKPFARLIGNIAYAVTTPFVYVWNLAVPRVMKAVQKVLQPLKTWIGKVADKHLAAPQNSQNVPAKRRNLGRRHRHMRNDKGTPGKDYHPKGLYILFLTEMWERFSFYLMIGILLPFLTDHEKGGMGLEGIDAAKIVGLYAAMVYFTPFIGGLLADRLLGLRRTIALGGFLMMVGHGLCALNSKLMFFSGLVFLVLGNGGFKPNISTLLGNMYPGKDEKSKALHDRAYSIFYVGINLGALICNIAAALVRNYFDRHPEYGIVGWHGAFGTAAIGMLIGLVNFVLNYRYLGQFEKHTETTVTVDGQEQKPEPKESLRPLWTQCLGPAALCGAIGYAISKKFNLALKPHNLAFLFACVPVLVFYFNVWRQLKSPLERGRTAVLMVVISFSIVFWSVFHQNHTALNEHAVSKTDRNIPASLEPVTRAVPDFAEEAPLSYFFNASPETPRPSPERYMVVGAEAYKEFKKQDKLMVYEPGKPSKLRVTAEQFDQVYRFKNSSQAETHRAINAEIYQSINPACVLLFTPLILALFFYLRGENKKGKRIRPNREPSTPAKIAIGIIIVGGGPLTMLACTLATNDAAIKASSWWLIGSYAIATVGELFLSPMGTGLVHKLAPRRIQAFMMGGWFMSSAIGNKLSGVFGEMYYTWDHATFYGVLTAFCFVAGGLLLCLVPWMKRQMKETEEEAVSVSLNLTSTILAIEGMKAGQPSPEGTSDPAATPTIVLDPEFAAAIAADTLESGRPRTDEAPTSDQSPNQKWIFPANPEPSKS